MRALVAAAALFLRACGRERRQSGTLDAFDPKPLAASYPFYHTSDSLVEDASTIATSCEGAEVAMESDSGAFVPTVRLHALGGKESSSEVNSEAPLRVMMVFGEHARELISPEAGLHFFRNLCGEEGRNVRKTTSFLLALNANPQGRASVESGEYCVRTNEDDVDLNRNYGDHWKEEKSDDPSAGVAGKRGQQFESFSSGTKPFSEPETRIVARLLNQTSPDVFVDVHSGTRGLFMPYDWTTDEIPNERDRTDMRSALQEIHDNDCPECSMGGGAETVGYLAPGASADYAYALGVKYSFIWEIYEGDTSIRKVNRGGAGDQLSQSNQPDQQAVASFLSLRSTRTRHRQLDLPAWASEDAADLEPMEENTLDKCFRQFNPTTQDDYTRTVERWSRAFMRLCDIAQRGAKASAGSSSARHTQ